MDLHDKKYDINEACGAILQQLLGRQSPEQFMATSLTQVLEMDPEQMRDTVSTSLVGPKPSISFRPYVPPPKNVLKPHAMHPSREEVKSECTHSDADQRSSEPMPLVNKDIMAQIRATIAAHQNPDKIVDNAPKRGRPEITKECTPVVLKGLLLKWEDKLITKMNKEQRIDALFATVSRFFK